MAIDWVEARETAWRAGFESRPAHGHASFGEAIGSALAAPLRSASDLPAFPTSAVDGWAVAGPGPWTIDGEILAGSVPGPIDAGQAVKIATGAQVPAGCEGIIRLENAHVDGTAVSGETAREWREAGEEARAGEELLAEGTPITAPVVGLAAAAGYSSLDAYRRPLTSLVIFGDELLTSGVSREGRVRDSLGPMVPHLLDAAGGMATGTIGPVADTLDDHVEALRSALDSADVVCTTGGTMVGPVDHLHAALKAVDASYVLNTVSVRPGFPMLLARTPNGRFIAGLPGNPQSAVIAVVTIVAPLLAGLRGLPLPPLRETVLAEDVPGRGESTHLALVDPTGRRIAHHGSAMLRGLASAAGFALIAPGTAAKAGQRVPLVPVPGVSA
ncbi:molybdopterin molybdotransferase MoeA [Glycomyces buryatensis]|uniref:Molybdopterin molybdenumtransferase n=1 Tax=Glycomyces buryatensis TaxID=2570927 RepID=A0A4V4HST6_9ACTN|nr:molybdopterin molybdotransferase MoeA [Glycomyces buryatensis]THV42976.1 molybdopterin molybdotransferase MoeA [Glycomyces buryatensis]